MHKFIIERKYINLWQILHSFIKRNFRRLILQCVIFQLENAEFAIIDVFYYKSSALEMFYKNYLLYIIIHYHYFVDKALNRHGQRLDPFGRD